MNKPDVFAFALVGILLGLGGGMLLDARRHDAVSSKAHGEAPTPPIVVDESDLGKTGVTVPLGAWIAGPRLPEHPENGRLYTRLGGDLVTVCVVSDRWGNQGVGWNCAITINPNSNH